jgi:hypothetical protein
MFSDGRVIDWGWQQTPPQESTNWMIRVAGTALK